MCIYKDKQCLLVSESFQFNIRNTNTLCTFRKHDFENSESERSLSWLRTLFKKCPGHNWIGNSWWQDSGWAHAKRKWPGLKKIRRILKQQKGKNRDALRQRPWADWQRRYLQRWSTLERLKNRKLEFLGIKINDIYFCINTFISKWVHTGMLVRDINCSIYYFSFDF